jgi:hypothetical protein
MQNIQTPVPNAIKRAKLKFEAVRVCAERRIENLGVSRGRHVVIKFNLKMKVVSDEWRGSVGSGEGA